MKPKPEDTILAECSRLSFQEAHKDRVISTCQRGEIDWDLVYRAAVVHRVAPLVYLNLKKCCNEQSMLPSKVVSDFENLLRLSAIRNALARLYISQAAAYFAARSQDTLLIKHAALSMVLEPLYEATTSTDIDLVVRPKDEDLDQECARYRWPANGTRNSTWDVIDEFDAAERPEGRRIHLEVDNRLHHDAVWNGVVAIDFCRVWRDAKRAQVKGCIIHVPDVHDMIIFSAVSLFRRSHLRLRNVSEIHEVILKEKQFDWDALVRKARAYRCNSLLYAALCTSRGVLETEFPASVAKALRPTAVKGRVVDFGFNRLSPCCIGCSEQSAHMPRSSPSLGDVTRRFLALNVGQLLRYLTLRVVLKRVFRIVKY